MREVTPDDLSLFASLTEIQWDWKSVSELWGTQIIQTFQYYNTSRRAFVAHIECYTVESDLPLTTLWNQFKVLNQLHMISMQTGRIQDGSFPALLGDVGLNLGFLHAKQVLCYRATYFPPHTS